MIITIGGSPGSGKSTLAKRLSTALGYRRYYMGQLFRDAARDNGMTLHEFGKYCETHPEMDRKVDAYQATLGKRFKNFVIEGRTSYHFIPHSVKIYLYVTPREGATRIFTELKRNKKERNEVQTVTTVSALERAVVRRKLSEKRRYRKWFGIDPFLKSNYDLFLDTSKLTKEQVYRRVTDFLATKGLRVASK